MATLANTPPPPPLPKQLWVAAIDAWTAAGKPRHRVPIPFRWKGHPYPLVVIPVGNSLHVSYPATDTISGPLLGHRRIPKP